MKPRNEINMRQLILNIELEGKYELYHLMVEEETFYQFSHLHNSRISSPPTIIETILAYDGPIRLDRQMNEWREDTLKELRLHDRMVEAKTKASIIFQD